VNYHRFVVRRAAIVAFAFLCIPTALFGQYAGRHGGSKSGNPGSTAPAEDPDLTNLKRAVAVEATDAQAAEFRVLAKCTDAARQKAQVLQQAGSEAAVSNATALQDALDEVQRQGRGLLNTFSDAQASGLKKQTKKLNQSDERVVKGAKKLAEQLDRIPPDPQRLKESATNLEQALTKLQSEQNALSKEMGIDAQ
jgi:chromosome segregation ATPase